MQVLFLKPVYFLLSDQPDKRVIDMCQHVIRKKYRYQQVRKRDIYLQSIQGIQNLS